MSKVHLAKGSDVEDPPPVWLLHVLLGHLVGLAVHIDRVVGLRAHEFAPDLLALRRHLGGSQALQLPDGLHEQQVLGGVLALQEGQEVVPPNLVLEQLPAWGPGVICVPVIGQGTRSDLIFHVYICHQHTQFSPQPDLGFRLKISN